MKDFLQANMLPPTNRGYVCVDFDQTLAQRIKHESYDPKDLSDFPPVAAMVNRVKAWLLLGEDVCIFTSRVARPDADAQRKAIEHWCEKHIGRVLPVTCIKQYTMVRFWDDRAVQVALNMGVRLG